MDNINVSKQNGCDKMINVKNIIVTVMLFVMSLIFSASAGIFGTVPFFFAGGIVCAIMGVSALYSVLFSGVMTLCLYLAGGMSVALSIVFAVACCVFVAGGFYFAALLRVMKKTKNKSVKRKCVLLCVLTLLASFAVSLCLCGNAFSFYAFDKENTLYITQSYGDGVQKKYTRYDAASNEYRTYVTFKDNEYIYGQDNEVFVVCYKDSLHDGVRDIYEEKMLQGAKKQLESLIVGATFGFNVVKCDIELENGELLSADSDFRDYLARVKYVVSFDSIIKEGQREEFVSVCRDTVKAVKDSGFEYDELLFCAGDVESIVYTARIEKQDTEHDVNEKTAEFDEKTLEKFGVSKNDVLCYWQNK